MSDDHVDLCIALILLVLVGIVNVLILRLL